MRSGEVAGDQCVFFSEAVRAGESVTMDYGAGYMVNRASQLRQFRAHELRAVVETVLGRADPRVGRALAAYMET